MKYLLECFRTGRTDKPALFLAYCSIARALRHERILWTGETMLLALVVPAGRDVDVYAQAAEFPARGTKLFGRHRRSFGSTLVEPLKADKKSKRFDLAEFLAAYERIVLVAESNDVLPKGIESIADAVLQLDPVHPRQVQAAAKLCLGQKVTSDQAARIASFPLAAIATAWRKGKGPTKAIEAMEAMAVPKPRATTGPTLDELNGMGEAGEWGKELARDLADWQAGRISWNEIDRGLLVSGPPGCGKTTFAQALARTCGTHLVAGSLAQWQARGHLGDLLKAMREAFEEARKHAPSILFIDEIDSIGDRARFSGDNAHYSTEVVNGLLECLDGVGGREGVVVVGATNFPEKLDAALTRPGRLDRHVCIPFPDQETREQILKWHSAPELSEADLSLVARRTAGWTGAALEQMVRQARRKARRARRGVSAEDLEAQLPRMVPIPASVLGLSAVHEAGHAVVALALGIGRLDCISIVDAVAEGESGIRQGGGAKFLPQTFPERTRPRLLDWIAMVLGGLAAEEVVFGSRSAAGGGNRGTDLHVATVGALEIEAAFGLGESLSYLSACDEEELLASLQTNPELRERVERLLTEQFGRAKRAIEANRAELKAVADALLRKRALTAAEVRKLVAPPSSPKASAARRKTGKRGAEHADRQAR